MPQQRDPMRPAGTAELMRKRAADKAARDEAMQAVAPCGHQRSDAL